MTLTLRLYSFQEGEMDQRMADAPANAKLGVCSQALMVQSSHASGRKRYGQILHGSATTTEAVRRAIQHSQESLSLALHVL